LRLLFEYKFEIAFSAPVTEHAFAVIASPHSSQRVEGLKVELKNYNATMDGFGNRIFFGEINESHEKLSYSCKGALIQGLEDTDSTNAAVFLQSTALTPFCKELDKYDNKLNLKHKTPLEKAKFVVSFIFGHFTYERGHTDHRSSIVEILTHEKGVCQDFAHLMIAIMRLEGVPSRYASGLCEGEGESHAWVECLIDGVWLGFDPTHNCLCSEGAYVKFAHGRDYDDCTPNKGTFKGQGAWQFLVAHSKVTRELL
jgi:transglutaminase-like putative cysteine protease